RAFTSEAQLHGTSGPIDWLLGAYFEDERIRVSAPLVWGSDAPLYVAHIFNPFGPVGSGSPGLTPVAEQIALCILGQANANPGCAGAGRSGTQPDPLYELGDGYSDHFTQSGRAMALFMHDIWHITEELALTGGLRWSHESKHGTYDGGVITWHDASALYAACPEVGGSHIAVSGGVGSILDLWCPREPYDADFSEQAATGTAVLSFRPSDALMFYAG